MKSSTKVAIQRVSLLEAQDIFRLNEEIFNETKLISHYDHTNLVFLIAYFNQIPVGFKVGYELNKTRFYSAKGGVLPKFRRQEIGTQLLYKMKLFARLLGYSFFCYDTFPSLYPGMFELGKKEGFKEVLREWNESLQAEKVRMETEL